MASFDNHLEQCKKNLDFLGEISFLPKECWDWQITVGFYAAVHMVNAHIAKIANLHYRTHEQTKDSINPYGGIKVCAVPVEIYLAYVKLESLSRRARYLCHDDYANRDSIAFFTYDKHLAKAIKNLDVVLNYFGNLYNIELPVIDVKCPALSSKTQLRFFNHAKRVGV